jgi:hypothetical protein
MERLPNDHHGEQGKAKAKPIRPVIRFGSIDRCHDRCIAHGSLYETYPAKVPRGDFELLRLGRDASPEPLSATGWHKAETIGALTGRIWSRKVVMWPIISPDRFYCLY